MLARLSVRLREDAFRSRPLAGAACRACEGVRKGVRVCVPQRGGGGDQYMCQEVSPWKAGLGAFDIA